MDALYRDYILSDIGLYGVIIFSVGGICLRIIFHSKMTKRIIDELNKNFYCDVADKFQEIFDYKVLLTLKGGKMSRLEGEATKLFSKLTLPPEQTKLRCYQRFFKISTFLAILGAAIFLGSFFLRLVL